MTTKQSISNLTPVILSGGSGTRLWPLSRENQPKQFLPLTGHDTMLQATARRLNGLEQAHVVQSPIVVCNSEHRFMAAEQLRSAGIEQPRIMLEPAARNTAPALTLAALEATRNESANPVLLVMPADHVILDLDHFHAAVLTGLTAAHEGALVTFGIVPERPETGYGYIRTGAPCFDGALSLEAFVEKPDEARARDYLSAGNYLWNSGIFMMRADVWLTALQKLQPEMAAACKNAFEQAEVDRDFVRIKSEAFAQCP